MADSMSVKFAASKRCEARSPDRNIENGIATVPPMPSTNKTFPPTPRMCAGTVKMLSKKYAVMAMPAKNMAASTHRGKNTLVVICPTRFGSRLPKATAIVRAAPLPSAVGKIANNRIEVCTIGRIEYCSRPSFRIT